MIDPRVRKLTADIKSCRWHDDTCAQKLLDFLRMTQRIAPFCNSPSREVYERSIAALCKDVIKLVCDPANILSRITEQESDAQQLNQIVRRILSQFVLLDKVQRAMPRVHNGPDGPLFPHPVLWAQFWAWAQKEFFV